MKKLKYKVLESPLIVPPYPAIREDETNKEHNYKCTGIELRDFVKTVLQEIGEGCKGFDPACEMETIVEFNVMLDDECKLNKSKGHEIVFRLPFKVEADDPLSKESKVL